MGAPMAPTPIQPISEEVTVDTFGKGKQKGRELAAPGAGTPPQRGVCQGSMNADTGMGGPHCASASSST
ncbi:hypothetical protein D3C87_1302580 [compost metagenome]